MNLLPKSHAEFSQKEYWNTFFKKRGKKVFEWYGEYPELCEHLHKYIKSKDTILMIGCGNSNLSADLYDVGYRNITNIDISQVVIRNMGAANKSRSDMKFIHMDALNMSFDNEIFTVVLDKGTLDALMPDDSSETLKQIDKLFSEIERVLKIGGRFVCISLLQEHILTKLLAHFPKSNWMFRVVRCHEAEKKADREITMPVFAIICTKFKQLPHKILEICMSGDKMQRMNSEKEVLESVHSMQQAALVLSGLNKNSIADENEISLDLYDPDLTVPRYTVYVIDQPADRKNGQFAAFIVPQGRETEWLFSTKEGRSKLLKSANHNRLAVVLMHRGHKYNDLESVKAELSENIKNLAPSGLTAMIPYLSLGSDVGHRETKFEGTSDFSGSFVVEDCTLDNNQIFRRLVFLNNQFVVQSEAKLKNVKIKGKKKLCVDINYLACQHHMYMSIGAYYGCLHGDSGNVLVVGLGGGGLCSFLNLCLPDSNITAVEIDSAILQVATDWFGLKLNNKLHVYVQNGLEYLEMAAKNGVMYDAILFDVDNKNSSVGMNCPPKEFLEPSVLDNVKTCIRNNGIFVLNLVLRNDSLHKSVVNSLKSKFKTLACYKLQEDLNEIIMCKNDKTKKLAQQLAIATTKFNEVVNERSKQTADDFVDIEEIMEGLKIL